MNKRILMIINEFPPTGESGVQRPLKFVKYLSRAGYKVYVIAPKKPTKKVLDYSLLKEIPENVHIQKTISCGLTGNRTKSIRDFRYNVNRKPNIFKKIIWKLLKNINDLIFPIDKQIGWVPFAYFKAIKLIKKFKIKNVYITGFPYSAFIIGVLLKKKFHEKIFWLADYRDAWQFEPKLDENINKLRLKIIKKTESKIIRYADYFVFATDYITEKYRSEFPEIVDRSITITNGYDEDDFKKIVQFKFNKFTFLYMGKLYSFKRSPVPLLNAMKKYLEIDNNFEFNFIHIGTVAQEILDYISTQKMNFYNYLGYKSHHNAISYASGANISVIIVNNDPESKGVLTGKVFELARIGNPILALGPRNSLLENFIIENELGEYAFCEDEKEILKAIEKIINKKNNFRFSRDKISEYSRESLTKKLIECYPK
ncbi:MAG: hypothetical protein K9N40_04275 [Candidatus Cloacimonetes bacterium]|nr:hypothetical protein [Candidatus Cloacimonadota bacterium]